jgi:hypothetical protein
MESSQSTAGFCFCFFFALGSDVLAARRLSLLFNLNDAPVGTQGDSLFTHRAHGYPPVHLVRDFRQLTQVVALLSFDLLDIFGGRRVGGVAVAVEVLWAWLFENTDGVCVCGGYFNFQDFRGRVL